jgi:nitrite reductase (NADH) large subunit
MKRIFIVGNTLAASKTAELIRRQDAEAELTIFSTDGFYPYEADRLVGLMGGKSSKDMLVQPKDFYEKNKITVLLDKTISKINLKRSRIFTEQKDQLEYDILVIADLPAKKFPDLKGANKEGIFNFRSLPQVEALVKKLLLAETIAIQADSFEAFEFACALKKRGKEVSLFISDNSFLTKKFSSEAQRQIIEYFNVKGLPIYIANEIVEILGDSDVKAIRLKSGKVLAAHVVLLENMREDWRIFSENEQHQISGRFEVSEAMETSVANVYAFSPIAISRNTEISESYVISSVNQLKEARIVVSKISGQEIALEETNSVKTVTFEDMTIQSDGVVNEAAAQQLISG